MHFVETTCMQEQKFLVVYITQNVRGSVDIDLLSRLSTKYIAGCVWTCQGRCRAQ